MNSTKNNQTLEIAQTILNQIKYFDRVALMAWGATNMIAMPSSKEFQGGLRFRVNGLKFRGFVMVMLRWVDDYTISFLDSRGNEKKKVEGAYCDMLVDVIDWIEGK